MGSQVAEMRQIFSVNKDKYAIWDGSFNDKPFAILNANKFLMHRLKKVLLLLLESKVREYRCVF